MRRADRVRSALALVALAGALVAFAEVARGGERPMRRGDLAVEAEIARVCAAEDDVYDELCAERVLDAMNLAHCEEFQCGPERSELWDEE